VNAFLPAPFLTGPLPHGGPDVRGPARWDFSTNSNACGPCPQALADVQQADASRYPDPSYTALRQALADFHRVEPQRIVLAASASEFIWRITVLAVRHGATTVSLPAHSYGDYAQAARAWGLQIHRRSVDSHPPIDVSQPVQADLHWACDPSSPLGLPDLGLPDTARWPVLDCAYRPLQMQPAQHHSNMSALFWQLWTPNKALGLTGVRAAYAIAPIHSSRQEVAELIGLAPSWPVGAHGVALLHSWVQQNTQNWLTDSLYTLHDWKAQQQTLCTAMGWQVQQGSMANYFTARPPVVDLVKLLEQLRQHGVQLRDCTSFGLPGWVRLGVLPPPAQQALEAAWLITTKISPGST